MNTQLHDQIQARHAQNDLNSPLLRLAPELRTTIGKMALLSETEILIPEISRASNLLPVSPRLRHELSAMFFKHNVFAVHETTPHPSDRTDVKEPDKEIGIYVEDFLSHFPTDMVSQKQCIKIYPCVAEHT